MVFDQAFAAGRFGSDNRQRAGHCFERDIAKSFGDRRVEQHIHRSDRAAKVGPALKSGEHRLRQTRLKPVARRAFADHQHAVGKAALGQFVDRVGKYIEPFFHHQSAKEADHHFVIADPERAPPLRIAAIGVENGAIDPA